MRMSFVESLSHLQSLLGRQVVVTIRPPDDLLGSVALLSGWLGGDGHEIIGGFPEGAAAFVLGFGDEFGGHLVGYFVIDPARFEGAELSDNTLVIRSAGTAVTVTPDEK
jgi:hypothetical protein